MCDCEFGRLQSQPALAESQAAWRGARGGEGAVG